MNAITEDILAATGQRNSRTSQIRGQIRNTSHSTFRPNVRLANKIWGKLPKAVIEVLRELSCRFQLSVSSGDVQLLDGHWYITHSGLLGIAR